MIRRAMTVSGMVLGLCLPAAAQTYTLAPLAYQTVLDANGNPVSGAKVCTYTAGSTTPATTYSTSTGTSNTNPITTDSAGRFVVYLAPGASYKFIFQDSTGTANTCDGAIIRTVDNIAAVPSSASNVDLTLTAGEALTAGQAVYISDGSGSKTTGQVYKADSTNTYSSSAAVVVGMVPASIASGASGTVRIAGYMTGLTVVTGSTYYVSTSGTITATAPTNARKLGIADTTSTLVLVTNPVQSVTFAPTYITKAIDYTAACNDWVVYTGSTARTLTLPAASTCLNKPIWIQNNSTAVQTIARNGSDTIGLGTTMTLQPGASAAQGDAVQLISDGVSNWGVPGRALVTPPRALAVANFEVIANRYTSTVSGGTNGQGTAGLSQDTTATISRYASLGWRVDYTNGNVFANSPTFTAMFTLDTIGTDLQAFLGIGNPTFAAAGITFTPRHVGFKIIRAASGTVSLFATQADGATETASSALTTLAATDIVNVVSVSNGSTSATYYWSKNGSAWSAPTVLTTNMPTTAAGTGGTDDIYFGVTNAGVATQTVMKTFSASYAR